MESITYIQCDIHTVHSTPKAVLLRIGPDEAWVPKSLVRNLRESTAELPTWLVADKFPGFQNPQHPKETDWSRFITVFADASWSAGCYGAGVWMRTNTKSILMGYNGHAQNSTDAELYALVSGIEYADFHLRTSDDLIVVAKTDCKSIIPRVEQMFSHIPNLYVRHVEGHRSSKQATRYWVNNQCDYVANKYRKLLLDGIKLPDLTIEYESSKERKS